MDDTIPVTFISKSDTRDLHTEKLILLRNRISLLVFFVGIAFIIIDLTLVPGLIPGSAPYYAGLLCFSLLALFLNIKGYYLPSSFVILITVNVVTFVFASSAKGVMFAFVPAAIIPLVLFGKNHFLMKWMFPVLSYCLFAFCYFSSFAFFPAENVTKEFLTIDFFVTATVSLVAAILIVHFLINLNYGVEKKLLNLTADLRTSKTRFELVAKGSRAGIYEWNLKTNALYVSSEWKKVLGYSDAEFQKFNLDSLIDICHPDDRQSLKKTIENHFITREPFQNESRRRHKSGEYRWIFDSGLSTVDKNGDLEIVVGSIIDITERKNAELHVISQNELLLKENQQLDKLVYSASHDLRSPLSSVLGLISLAEATDSKEEIKGYHTMMRKNVKKLDGFINEIMDYSRNSGQGVVKESKLLCGILHEVVENLRFADGANGMVVQNNVSPELEVATDYHRLKIVLNNLIGNSIKYSDRDRSLVIKIDAYIDNDHLLIIVEDNGIGVAKEHQDKIFDMFYRATEKSDGSGLGLYITKEVIEKLNGTIQLTSSEGLGSTFRILLPV